LAGVDTGKRRLKKPKWKRKSSMKDKTKQEIPKRSEVAIEDQWDLSSLFPDEKAWRAALAELEAAVPSIAAWEGTLGNSAQQLKSWLDESSRLELLEERLGYWAHLKTAEDAGDSKNQERFARYMQVATSLSAAASFATPEILSIDSEKIEAWIAGPDFDEYRIALKKLLRFRDHTLSPAEEKILAMQGEVRQIPTQTFSSLCDVDFDFGTVKTPEGEKPLSQSTLSSFLMHPDGEVRERAYRQFYSLYDGHKNSLANLYSGSIRQDIYLSRVRKYPSARAMALFPDDVPESVYDNLVATVREHFPLLHRYYRIKASRLGKQKLSHWDVYMPMVGDVKTSYPYEKGIETVIDALSPLGDEYCRALRSGLSGRWVDRYENRGKRSGAFSAGSYAGDPYILLNYKEDVLRDLFTLAHEAGHSMHSWYSARNNPFSHYQYTIFEAEVASTFNEQLLAKYLIEGAEDAKTADYVAAKQADDIVATLFRQTMFAEFEAAAHKQVEEGKPVSLDSLRTLYRSLLTDYFGPGVDFIEESDLEGLRIPHFYRAFYVYKYSTGIAASVALSEKVLQGGEKELSAYLEFLKGGGRYYPIESLRRAGVDMSSPEPIQQSMVRFSAILDRLEDSSF